MSWWAGNRIALWLVWRIGTTGEDRVALIRTAWAVRRLAASRRAGGDRVGQLAAHLGLESPPGVIEDFAASLPGPGELGSVATGCLVSHVWRLLIERPAHLRDTEAAVHRNLALFEARGLVREVTRQGRFRVWIVSGKGGRGGTGR